MLHFIEEVQFGKAEAKSFHNNPQVISVRCLSANNERLYPSHVLDTLQPVIPNNASDLQVPRQDKCAK